MEKTKATVKWMCNFVIIGLIILFWGYVWWCDEIGDEDLGDGYQYYEEYKHIRPIRYNKSEDNPVKKFLIPSYVENYNYNNRFIIAKQSPRGDKLVFNIYNNLIDFPAGPYWTYYWIIDKREEQLYGPLIEEQYNHLSDSLNINLHFRPKVIGHGRMRTKR